MTDKQSPGFKDRRFFRRVHDSFFVTYNVQTPFAVRVKLGDKECDAVVQDIGEGGMGLLTNYDIPASALLTLKFMIFNDLASEDKDRSRRFELGGEVRYKVYTQDKAYRLGVAFVKISEAERYFIADYVQTQALKPKS